MAAERLDQIARAATELDRCVRERGSRPHDQGWKWGVTMGECDWLEELHRLIYEETK